MARNTPFKAYNSQRKKLQSLGSLPAKITSHRVDRNEWESSKTKASPSKTNRVRKQQSAKRKTVTTKGLRTAIDVLRYTSDEIQCLHCGRLEHDPNCGTHCYRQFREQNFTSQLVDIKGPDPVGYGAFTKPGVHIKKGQWLEEYLGDLRPIDDANTSTSLYRFEIPGVCVVDAEKAGNWTRFINSHCRPNVKPWGEHIGKRHVVLFQALRDIGPEEELVFSYGKKYFERAGFACACTSCARLPEKAHTQHLRCGWAQRTRKVA